MIMQKQLFTLLITILIAYSSYAQLKFTITNPFAVERRDELIILKRSDIEKSLDKKINLGIRLQSESKDLFFQLIDADNNKQWDQIVFLCSFKPKETKRFTLEFNKSGSAYGTAPLAH